MSYSPLHVHSEYSNLDGVARVVENVERAVELGCPCCGLTDHMVVSGHLELAKQCDKHGIKPIFGVEAYLGTKTTFAKNERDQAHQILFAGTDEGLRNLWRIVDDASHNFRYVDRTNYDALQRHSAGVWATSSCMQGLVPQGLLRDDYEPLNRALEIWGDRFIIELHTYPGEEHERMNWALVNAALERGIPMIPASDSHFARPEQYEIFDMYIARQTGDNIYTPHDERKMWHPPGMHIMDTDEIKKALGYLPAHVVEEAIKFSGELEQKIDAHLPEVERHMPVFVPKDCPWKDQFDDEKDAKDIFAELVWAGIHQRYGDDPRMEVIERTNMELEALTADEKAGLWHYFLLGWDTKQFCLGAEPAMGFDWVTELRGKHWHEIITGPGRGSSAGCIVAYALGITDVDPLPYDLYFERFWNPGRAKGFPDIDTDFPRRDRKTVLHYLGKRWGEEAVRQIGNISRMKPKDVIEKTGYACGASGQEVNELKRIVDKNVPDLEIHGPDQIGWSEDTWPGKVIYVMHPTEGECKHAKETTCAHCHNTGELIVEWVSKLPRERQPIILRWIEVLDFLCGRVGGYGVHASGILISNGPRNGEVPCRWANGEEVKAPVTMFNMDDVEARMYIKYDALGLRTLDTLEVWRELVADEGIDLQWSGIEWWDHPVDMWELLDDGYGAGIFQLERGFPVHLAKSIKPRSVEDLSHVLALNRPGPIRSGAPASFVRRRQGVEDVSYDDTKDPKDSKNGWLLAPILEPTYGWFLYQEQIIRFFETIGYDKSDADAIRKILGKKKPEDMRDVGLGAGEWEGKGYRVMAKEAGLQPEAISTIWNRLEGFASYSFNKSHTVAYGTVSFRTLFAKFNAPVQWYLACVRTVDDSKKAEFVPRYINEARRMGIEIKPPHIYRSKADIAVVDDDILYGFRNVKHVKGSASFIEKLRDTYDVSSPEKVREALEQYDLDNNIEERRAKARAAGKAEPKTGSMQLQSNKIEALAAVGAFDETSEVDYKLRERQAAEKELLGVILTDNAAEAYANHYDEIQECDPYHEVLDSEWDGEDLHFCVPGIINELTEKRARKTGKAMGIVKIEYEGDEIEFVVRPDLWRSHKFLWHERTPGIFHLKRYQGGVSFEKGHSLT